METISNEWVVRTLNFHGQQLTTFMKVCLHEQLQLRRAT
jgi:hypothetical protein